MKNKTFPIRYEVLCFNPSSILHERSNIRALSLTFVEHPFDTPESIDYWYRVPQVWKLETRDRRCCKFCCVTVARVCDRFSDFEISGSAWGRVSLSNLDSIMHDWILAWYRYVWFSHKLDRSNFYNQPFCLFHIAYKSFDSLLFVVSCPTRAMKRKNSIV